jgi:hypothetical protein
MIPSLAYKLVLIARLMKPRPRFLGGALTLIFTIPLFAADPAPRIMRFNNSGDLIVGNVAPGTVATVEWAPSPTGPWTNSWEGLQNLVADSRGVIRAKVAMFYRVRVERCRS